MWTCVMWTVEWTCVRLSAVACFVASNRRSRNPDGRLGSVNDLCQPNMTFGLHCHL